MMDPDKSIFTSSDDDWRLVDSKVGRFEHYWNSGSPVEISQFALPADSPLFEVLLTELIKVDQEWRLRNGQARSLEEYLQDWPELEHSPIAVQELLEAECLTRSLFAEPPAREEIAERFPQLADSVPWDSIETHVELHRRQKSWLHEGDYFGAENRYRIEELLGCGGMGAVYRTFDTKLHRDVALKIPFRDPHIVSEVGERFLREARAAAKISHPNVCPIFDADRFGGTFYLTMALIDGQSLAERIAVRKLEQKEAVSLATKIAAAMEAVHAAGFVHRDIKPSNVMIDQAGNPWLMDFGLAGPMIEEISITEVIPSIVPPPSLEERFTQSKGLAGTLLYMAPELLQGRKVSQASDIYSFGVLFYEMLCGLHPLTGEQNEKSMQSLFRTVPLPPHSLRPEINPQLDAICIKAMAKDPAERYASAAEIVHSLQEYTENSTTTAASPKKNLRSRLISVIFIIGFLFTGLLLFLKTGEGTLTLRINEKNVKIKIDDQEITVESDKAEVALPVGEHRVEFVKEGFEPYTDTITLSWRGGVTEVKINLKGKYISRCIDVEQPLIGMTVSHDANSIYTISNESPGPLQIRAIDVKSGKLHQSILSPIDDKAYKSIASSLDDRYLFVSDYYRKITTRIDLQNGNARANLDTGGRWCLILGATPDGKKLVVTAGGDGRVTDENNDQLAVVDIEGGHFDLLWKIVLEDELVPFQLAFSADSRFAYFVTRTRKSTSPALYEVALDNASQVPRKLEFPDSRLTGLAVSSKRNRIYVSDAGHKRINAVDLKTFQPVGTWEVEGQASGSIVLNPAENTLVALCPDTRKLVFLDPEDGTVLGHVVGLGENAFDLKYSPKGDELYVAHSNLKPGIVVVDPKPLLNECRIVFSSNQAGESYQLYVIGPDGNNLRRLTKDSGTDCFPRWSPDGRRVAYISDQKDLPRICIVKRNGTPENILKKTDPIWLWQSSVNGSLLDWSPDGTRIVFIGNQQRAIRVVDVKTDEVETLFDGEIEGKYTAHYHVQWDPHDGTIIVSSATAASGEDYGIFRLDPKTKQFQAIFRSSGSNYGYFNPAVERDGKRIAVTWREMGVRYKPAPLYLINSNGTDPQPLKCTEETINYTPRWTTTGKGIIYAGEQGNRTHLFFLRLAENKISQLTKGDWNDIEPDVWGEVKEY